MAEQGTITFEDHPITFRNFEGREGMYNAAGNRNFCLVLTPQEAEILTNDGWNIKTQDPKEEGDLPFFYVQVSARWGFKPPMIIMITSKGRTVLNENTVGILDAVDIAKVDVIIRPRDWSNATGAAGRKAYLKTMFVTIDEDELMMKYGFDNVSMAEEETAV